jgi:hypothetical protein
MCAASSLSVARALQRIIVFAPELTALMRRNPRSRSGRNGCSAKENSNKRTGH